MVTWWVVLDVRDLVGGFGAALPEGHHWVRRAVVSFTLCVRVVKGAA
ncbi:hypothetical protein [Kibdelosporangium philippinense]